ncbi:MAG TPA: 50S ribosomal protein L25 [Vicinamibacterales bacterium]|jgi:large subunit ribosomal protein L25|nr:50S ribosomal protein L25 [Vicinamibacterales bacterium]
MEAVLEAVRRDQFGRNNAGRLRREGRIPAVIYGQASAAESVAVDPKSLLRILHSQAGANTLIALKLEGGGDLRVLVKEYQLDPVSHGLLHADFYRVAMDKVIRVTIPIHLTGEAKGAKVQGGIVDFVHRELVVECLPGDIPESIAVDVTELMLHDGVRVRDIATGGTWKPVSDADMLIVHVVAPKTEAEPAAAEATAAAAPAAAAEPEVIKKGKTEKEDEKA